MAINFPNSPLIGQTYLLNGKRYFWDGVKWNGAGQPVGGGVPTYAYLSEVYAAIAATNLQNGDVWQINVDHPVLGTYPVIGTVMMGEPSWSKPIPLTQFNPLGVWQDAITTGSQYSVAEENGSYVFQTSGVPNSVYNLRYFDGVTFSRFANLRFYGNFECATQGGDVVAGPSIHLSTSPMWASAGNRVYANQFYWWRGYWRFFRGSSVNGTYAFTSQANILGGVSGFFSTGRDFQDTFDHVYLSSSTWTTRRRIQADPILTLTQSTASLGSNWRTASASTDRYFVGMGIHPNPATVGMKITLHGLSCDHMNENVLGWP